MAVRGIKEILGLILGLSLNSFEAKAEVQDAFSKTSHYVNDFQMRSRLSAMSFFQLVTQERHLTITEQQLPKQLHFSEPLQTNADDVEALLESQSWMIRLHCGGQPVPSSILKDKGHNDGVHLPSVNFSFRDGYLFRTSSYLSSISPEAIKAIPANWTPVKDSARYFVYPKNNEYTVFAINYLNQFFEEEVRVYEILETKEVVIEESLKTDVYHCENGEPVRKIFVSVPLS